MKATAALGIKCNSEKKGSDTSHDRPGNFRILQELPLRFTVLCG
jgi:hypothetical protein